MKKLLFALLTLIAVLSSCTRDNKFQKIIEENIRENALGMDIKPKFDSIVYVNKYTVDHIIKFWITKENYGGNIDTLINHFANVDNLKSESNYKWFKWQQGRFNELKNKEKEEVLYEVVKAFYKIEIPLIKTPTSVLNYYVIKDNKVLGMISEMDMQGIVDQNTDPIFAYEFVQFHKPKNKLP